MSFATDASAIALAAAQTAETTVKGALGALVGTYGLIKQHELNERSIRVTERGADRAERYLAMAESAYTNISLPSFERARTLYDSLSSTFGGYEAMYAAEGFRLASYVPDYATQEGRALGMVQSQLDKAALQRRRQLGPYATGRINWDATWFATMAALARVDAANHAYRFEDSRKRYWDDFYWKRWSAAARGVHETLTRALSALKAGDSVIASGLTSVGRAEQAYEGALMNTTGALGNMGDMWGSVANGAFRMAGYSLNERASDAMFRQRELSAAANPADESSVGYGIGVIRINN